MITYIRIFLRMRNVPQKSYRENQNKYFISITFSENRVDNEMRWKNDVENDRPQMTI